MKTPTRILAPALALAFALAIPAAAAAQDELHGGWVVSGWTAPDGSEAPVQRGLFLFTASGHYSIMFVRGEGREALAQGATDADVAAAYSPFVANSGRYMVDGNTITYEAYVSKDPAYMMGFAPTGGEGNAQTMTYSIADGVLTLEVGNGGPTGSSKMTLRRPGGGD